MRDGILPNFFTFALWKSILFWIIPLFSFLASTYIVAFGKDTLTYLVCWMSISLHPFVLVPVSVALDFITDCIKKCCKNTFKTGERCTYVNTMPLYLAFVCACQYYLISRWDLIQRKELDIWGTGQDWKILPCGLFSKNWRIERRDHGNDCSCKENKN